MNLSLTPITPRLCPHVPLTGAGLPASPACQPARQPQYVPAAWLPSRPPTHLPACLPAVGPGEPGAAGGHLPHPWLGAADGAPAVTSQGQVPTLRGAAGGPGLGHPCAARTQTCNALRAPVCLPGSAMERHARRPQTALAAGEARARPSQTGLSGALLHPFSGRTGL